MTLASPKIDRPSAVARAAVTRIAQPPVDLHLERRRYIEIGGRAFQDWIYYCSISRVCDDDAATTYQ